MLISAHVTSHIQKENMWLALFLWRAQWRYGHSRDETKYGQNVWVGLQNLSIRKFGKKGEMGGAIMALLDGLEFGDFTWFWIPWKSKLLNCTHSELSSCAIFWAKFDPLQYYFPSKNNFLTQYPPCATSGMNYISNADLTYCYTPVWWTTRL